MGPPRVRFLFPPGPVAPPPAPPDNPRVTDDAATAARFLRSNRAGVLLADETPSPFRFVIDGRTGRLIAPAPPALHDAGEFVLFIPEERGDALQLLLTPERLDDDDPAGDRWLAYHHRPDSKGWAAFAIESGRIDDQVIDGPALMVPNALAAAEPRLCKRCNAGGAEGLAAGCARAGIPVAAPLCVGVDPYGLDIRARFGIVRIDFAAPADSEAAAAAAIDALLQGARP